MDDDPEDEPETIELSEEDAKAYGRGVFIMEGLFAALGIENHRHKYNVVVKESGEGEDE